MIVRMLVRKEYDGLEAMSDGIRLKAEHIASGISEYGRTLVDPPKEAYDALDIIQISGEVPSQYSIRFLLFTAEEGESDLELRVTLIDDSPDALMRAEIDGILVA